MRTMSKKSVVGVLAGMLAVAPGIYAQTTDESGRVLGFQPAVIAPNLPTDPNVDLTLTAVTPCRVCDTRFGSPDAGGCAKGVIGAGLSRTVTIGGLCGIPGARKRSV